eukprot:CAMPEP_0194135330 /NCGR_PEP_ID=MMETSP0152-20130528/5433_1 /TAXON_ID=1049557 /ORGANISM="Thalassiothrix antarctica, Strain L6-D1" /LENGTH=38 /DNA_ID= /DNA_START= /DNA_END= /DNA_ORIENTATION=
MAENAVSSGANNVRFKSGLANVSEITAGAANTAASNVV